MEKVLAVGSESELVNLLMNHGVVYTFLSSAAWYVWGFASSMVEKLCSWVVCNQCVWTLDPPVFRL